MMNTRSTRNGADFELLAIYSKAGVVLALLCAASMWFFVDHVLIAHQVSDAAIHDRPRGNLSDLYPRWLGTRELLLRHRNPYGPEITREIQRGYYGRELDPRRPGDPIDQQGFAYPVYVAFLLAPTIKLPFETVRAAFQWFLIAVTAASVWLWFQAIGSRPKIDTLVIVVFLVLGSFSVVQALKLQQLTLLVSFLIALGAALLARDHFASAGVALAIATIKPQLVSPLLLCLVLWTLSDWAHRKRFLSGFAGTVAILLVGSELILPGWISNFRSALWDYRGYAAGESLVDTLLPQPVGRVFSVAALAAFLLVCWRFRKQPVCSREFQYMLVAVLALTLLVIPKFAPYNQVLLLPAIFLIAREGRVLWNKSWSSRMACCLTLTAIGWPWVACSALWMASFWLRPERLEQTWAIPLVTTLAISVVLLIQLGSLVRDAWQNRPVPAVAAPGR